MRILDLQDVCVTRVGLSGYEIRIYDEFAKEELCKNRWVGFDVQDALYKANKDLGKVGCEIVLG